MLPPFSTFPTLREFVEAAKTQGCEEKFARAIRGPRGAIQPRTLIRRGATTKYAILPNIPEDYRLSPVMLQQLVRTLGIQGFEQFIE
jgi:hypothetical protein